VLLVEDRTRVICLKASNPVTTAELGQQYSAEKAQMHPACGRRFPVGSVAVLRTTIDPRYDGPADLDGTRTRVVAYKEVTAATAGVEFNNCEVEILDGAHKGEHFHIPLECLVDEKGKHAEAESSIPLNPLHRRAQMDCGDAASFISITADAPKSICNAAKLISEAKHDDAKTLLNSIECPEETRWLVFYLWGIMHRQIGSDRTALEAFLKATERVFQQGFVLSQGRMTLAYASLFNNAFELLRQPSIADVPRPVWWENDFLMEMSESALQVVRLSPAVTGSPQGTKNKMMGPVKRMRAYILGGYPLMGQMPMPCKFVTRPRTAAQQFESAALLRDIGSDQIADFIESFAVQLNVAGPKAAHAVNLSLKKAAGFTQDHELDGSLK